MNEIKIINVDENGNEIQAIDWNIWLRKRVEEVYNDDGKVTQVISHCIHKPKEQMVEEISQEARNNLIATDYISAKLGDSLLECNTINDILNIILKFKDNYGNVIEQRKEWRNIINNPLQGGE